MKPQFTDSDRYPYGYTKSGATDIRKTFARARKAIAEAKEKQRQADEEAQRKTVQIRKVRP